MTISDRVRVKDIRVLSDNHYVLKTTTFEWRRANGEWQIQHRETYDRGNGATLLPYNLAQRTVVLVRQFRYPAYVNGYDDLLIEAAAGLLDNESPEVRIRAEAEEETGYRLGRIEKVFEAFMSPGSITEKLHFFVAEYDPGMRSAAAAASPPRARTSRCWSCRSIRRLRWSPMAVLRMPRPSCCCNMRR
jgi:nudix-type nucleoside diphosphatase (YffH/AdpP family)